ncbi:DUF6624 domain-containing protein [Desertivirga xinjiangensis]|uniref:DUF6624 domain-containing protein n=1 Tax=Desertivirga xinjiangensis TaxID=539206 RepID=UPI00210CBE16|nr:DUF6624 domain-containing protein [Pedobacter xinjiangensis]
MGQEIPKMKEYLSIIKNASNLYKIKCYKDAAAEYDRAFNLGDRFIRVADYYNSACCQALNNNSDRAIRNLSKAIMDGKYSNYTHILSDPDFKSLRKKREWGLLAEHVRVNELNKNRLSALLDSILEMDQNYRSNLDSVTKEFGAGSPKTKEYYQKMHELDSLNLLKVRPIIDSIGWPGPYEVGNKGGLAIFLVIQHSNAEVQEKYLPLMRSAAMKGNAILANLALLEDRVAISNGRKQLYGSQVFVDPKTNSYFLAPIEDEKNLNLRRKEMDLQPIEEYCKLFGIEYSFADK